MITSTEKTAIMAENKIDYIHKDFKEAWDLPSASMWVLTNKGDMVCVSRHPDVYELLEAEDTVQSVMGFEFFAVLTCGWAAPIDDLGELGDLPPSKHKKRRRVRLVVGSDYDGVASVIRFQDKPDETVVDAGMARGSLADSIVSLQKRKALAETADVMTEIKQLLEGETNE